MVLLAGAARKITIDGRRHHPKIEFIPSNQLSVVTVVALTKPRVRLRPKHVYTDEPTVIYTAAQVATDERHVSKHRLRKTCRVSLVLVDVNVKTRSVAEGPLA